MTQRQPGPGPVYDDAMKVLTDDDPAAGLALLGINGVRERLNIELTAPTLRADLLARTDSGLAHVEFVKDPDPGFGFRMVKYWTRIREAYPTEPIGQYVLTVGDRVPVPDRYVDGGMSCTWTVVRLADLDPATLLASPTTAALAALARGTVEQRAGTLAEAAQRIWAVPERDRGAGLISAAATLASIVLPRAIIRAAMKEANMPVLVRDTPLGRELYEEWVQQGIQQGVQQGRADLLRHLLQQRFGDDPRIDDIAARLVALPDEECLARIAAATDLDALIS